MTIQKYIKMFSLPEKVIEDSYWNEHLPFAFFLIEVLRPANYVELGVYKGGSYNAFCQAVKELKTGTKCYAIDNWEGDIHHGQYDLSVYNSMAEYQRQNYSSFSVLLKASFDDALAQFPDGSIDLLHIDGCHTYEAVKHDFERWLPKMSVRGAVILHDTNIREGDFGVWKLWGEISARYPSFEFKHGCGLGVLAVGRSVKDDFRDFLNEAGSNDFIGQLFKALGRSIIYELQLKEKDLLIKKKDEEIKHKTEQLKSIIDSDIWKITMKLSRLGQMIAPPNSLPGRFKKFLAKCLAAKR